jgi:hypothetical protein
MPNKLMWNNVSVGMGHLKVGEQHATVYFTEPRVDVAQEYAQLRGLQLPIVVFIAAVEHIPGHPLRRGPQSGGNQHFKKTKLPSAQIGREAHVNHIDRQLKFTFPLRSKLMLLHPKQVAIRMHSCMHELLRLNRGTGGDMTHPLTEDVVC